MCEFIGCEQIICNTLRVHLLFASIVKNSLSVQESMTILYWKDECIYDIYTITLLKIQ